MDVIQKALAQSTALFEKETERVRKFFDAHCESPIETALGIAIYAASFAAQESLGPAMALLTDCDRHILLPLGEYNSIVLVPQYRIGNRRADFAVVRNYATLLVECDGHDFHERTREQAVRDRRRDRKIISSSGHHIIRFAGSEIYADPCGCGSEVITIVSDLHWARFFDRAA